MVLSTWSLCIASASDRAGAGSARRPTLDDLLNLVQVSGAEISPDGTQVIYTKSELKKWSDNKRVTVDLDRQRRRHRSSAAARQRQGSVAGLVAGRPLRRLPVDARPGRERARRRRRAALAAADDRRRRSDEAERSEVRGPRASSGPTTAARIFFTADEPLSDPLKEARKNGGDGIFVDEGPNGQTRASFSNIWVITLADKQARQLTTGDHIVGDFAPSPDGKRVVYIAPAQQPAQSAEPGRGLRRSTWRLVDVEAADEE